MKDFLKRAAEIFGSIAIVGGGVWGILAWADATPVLSRDLEPIAQQVASNSQTLALQRWQYLEAKRQNQGLTASERVEFCALSRQLGLRGEGCA